MSETQQEDNLVKDHVIAQAEAIEELEDPFDFDPLEVYFEVSMRGTVKKAVAVTGTGGPHIEVDLTNGKVSGWWGRDEWTTHISPKADETLDVLDDHYVRMFEENMMA